MPRVLSQDLRERVVAATDGGMSCRAAAARFGVSAASAIRWRQLVVRHGRLSCPPLSGPSTMTVWTKEGTTNACQEAQARGNHREAARG
ncbi:hypothetical protein BRX43_18140 [Sphingomonas sp. S-NIH.Pt15_0812]|nr:hypothetical protein BRX43_18140 [Sphingomonas sp. S-NIH.Pt15_0812]